MRGFSLLFAAVGVALVIAICLSLMVASHACSERGGVYAQTLGGWKCLKAEELP